MSEAEKSEYVARLFAVPRYVCYSRPMSDEMIQILKAKTDAVAALAQALSRQYDAEGGDLTGQDAVVFANNWLSAMESMIPAAPGLPIDRY